MQWKLILVLTTLRQYSAKITTLHYASSNLKIHAECVSGHGTNCEYNTSHSKLLPHLPPYSGAMKCIFFMLSRHVLTWWWIASGATAERKSETHKVRLCIQQCLHGWGCSRSPHPLPSHPSAAQFCTQRPRSDSDGNSFCQRSRRTRAPSCQRTYAIGDMP